MTHRMTAVAILVLVGAAVVLSRKGEGKGRVARFATGWFCLILVQAFLGAYTVWSNKAADVATAHVACGALSLVWGSLLFIGTAPLARKTVVLGTIWSAVRSLRSTAFLPDAQGAAASLSPSPQKRCCADSAPNSKSSYNREEVGA